MNKKAFTFSELIIVVSLLAIISLIGFVSYINYVGSSRDSVRIQELTDIYKLLETNKLKTTLKEPTDSVSILANGDIIGKQGYLGDNVLSMIGYEGEGKDPLDGKSYIYLLSSNRKNIELLAFFEEPMKESYGSIYGQNLDKMNRVPTVFGSKLGILLTPNNIPINNKKELKNTGLDIENTGDEYIAAFSNLEAIRGNKNKLKVLYGTMKTGIIGESCDAYIEANNGYKLKSGDYLIKTNNGLEINNCSM